MGKPFADSGSRPCVTSECQSGQVQVGMVTRPFFPWITEMVPESVGEALLHLGH